VYAAFTRKAAHEARSRAKFGGPGQYSTLHSLAFRALEARSEEMMDWEDYRQLGRAMNLRFSKFLDADEAAYGGAEEGDRLRAVCDLAAARCIKPAQIMGMDVDPWRVEQFVAAVSTYKVDTGKRDFNDLLIEALDDVEPEPLDMAVIDEAQDLSTLQWKFAMKYFNKAKRLLIAGDDDQAIFTWAGADITRFLALKGKRTVLAQSYRCPTAVFHAADSVAHRIKQRQPKAWAPRNAGGAVQAVGSVEQVDIKAPGTHMLLARHGYLLKEWTEHCRSLGVPYLLRGEPSVRKEHLNVIRYWEKRRRGEEIGVGQRELINRYTARSPTSQEPWWDALTGIKPVDREFYRAALARGADLDAPPLVQINTVHGVKGGEADHVAILSDRSMATERGAEREPDGEHRVAYVALTRARQMVTIVRPQGPCHYPFSFN